MKKIIIAITVCILLSFFGQKCNAQTIPDTFVFVQSPAVLLQTPSNGSKIGGKLDVKGNTRFSFQNISEGDQGYLYAEHFVNGAIYSFPPNSVVKGSPNNITGNWDYVTYTYRGGVFYVNITPFSFFDVNNISDLSVNLDAQNGVYSDGNTTPATNGGTVQQWNDQSGNSKNAINTGAEKPTYRTNSLNGKPGIEFDNQAFLSISHTSELDATYQMSAFSVTNDNGTVGDRIFQKNAQNANLNQNYFLTVQEGFNVGSVVTYDDATAGNNILSGVWSGSYQYNYLNGVFRSSSTMNATFTDSLGVGYFRSANAPYSEASGPLVIGARDTTGGFSRLYFDSIIYQIVLIQRTVSDQERQAIEGALAWRWGLQSNLTAAHPYRYHAPKSQVYTKQWDSEILSAQPYDTYYGTPDIIKAANGDLIVTLDEYGPGTTEDTMRVFTSSDDGLTWTQTARRKGFWSSLFNRSDTTYLIGNLAQFGGIYMSKSTDNGATWGANQQIRLGNDQTTLPSYHTSAIPVLRHGKYYYKAFEELVSTNTPEDYQVFVMRADTNSFLLDSASWERSNNLAFSTAWLTAAGITTQSEEGFFESNVIENPSNPGALQILARCEISPIPNKAVLMDLDTSTMTVTFNQIVDLPGGKVKFQIYDDRDSSGYYFTITTPNRIGQSFNDQRNICSIYKSTDLINWTFSGDIYTDDFYNEVSTSVNRTGFQYSSFIMDVSDLLLVTRTAYARAPFLDRAEPYHEADRITFKRIANFRNYLE